MALSADRAFKAKDGVYQDLLMAASQTLYKGAFVSIDPAAGTARVVTASDQFGGICTEKAVSAASGSTFVTVRRRGTVRITGQSSLTQAMVGDLVYASDDATLTTTAGTNVLVGRIVKFESASIVWVELAAV